MRAEIRIVHQWKIQMKTLCIYIGLYGLLLFIPKVLLWPERIKTTKHISLVSLRKMFYVTYWPSTMQIMGKRKILNLLKIPLYISVQTDLSLNTSDRSCLDVDNPSPFQSFLNHFSTFFLANIKILELFPLSLITICNHSLSSKKWKLYLYFINNIFSR